MNLFDKIADIIGKDSASIALPIIKRGMKKSRGPAFYNLTAPIVVPFALMGCKWESEKLPNWARKWDNNVNLNGDNGDWVDVDSDGKADVIRQSLEDSPEVRARCYWAKGHHPRSFWARYVWVGFRNRGKWAYVDAGIEIDIENTTLETFGEHGIRGEKDGAVVNVRGGLYHYHSAKRFLHFFCLIEQRGWKVQNVDSISRIAIPVSYRSLKRWKKRS